MILLLVVICIVIVPVLFGSYVTRIVKQKLIEKGYKHVTPVSVLTFILSVALAIYAIFLFIDHNYTFER